MSDEGERALGSGLGVGLSSSSVGSTGSGLGCFTSSRLGRILLGMGTLSNSMTESGIENVCAGSPAGSTKVCVVRKALELE